MGADCSTMTVCPAMSFWEPRPLSAFLSYPKFKAEDTQAGGGCGLLLGAVGNSWSLPKTFTWLGKMFFNFESFLKIRQGWGKNLG